MKPVEPARRPHPDRALLVFENGAGLAIGQAVGGGVVFNFACALGGGLNARQAAEVMGKPQTAIVVSQQQGDTRNTNGLRTLVVQKRPDVMPRIADPDRAVGRLRKLIHRMIRHRDGKKFVIAFFQLKNVFLVGGPQVSVPVKEQRVEPFGGQSVARGIVFPGRPGKVHKAPVGGCPYGTIFATQELFRGFAHQAVVFVVVDFAAIAKVGDATHPVADPESAVAVARKRRNVGRGKLWIGGGERIRRELQSVEAVQTESRADPKISIAGLRECGDIAGGAIATNPAHVRHIFERRSWLRG